MRALRAGIGINLVTNYISSVTLVVGIENTPTCNLYLINAKLSFQQRQSWCRALLDREAKGGFSQVLSVLQSSCVILTQTVRIHLD